jgi:hypothetical protein
MAQKRIDDSFRGFTVAKVRITFFCQAVRNLTRDQALERVGQEQPNGHFIPNQGGSVPYLPSGGDC